MAAIVDSKEGLARGIRSLGVDVHDVLASVPDGVIVLDRRQRAVAVLGRWPYGGEARTDDLLGNRVGDVFGSAALHDQANTRAFQGEVVTYEWVARGRQDLRLTTTVAPLRNAASRIVGLVSVTRGVGALGDDERRLLELERGLRQMTEVIEGYRRRDAAAEDRASQLSSREQDVLRLLREGYRPRSIAQLLQVSPQTVRNHLKAIFRKTGTHSQEELITRFQR